MVFKNNINDVGVESHQNFLVLKRNKGRKGELE